MKKLIFFLTDSLRILKRHKLITFLLILQNIICLFLVGVAADQFKVADESINKYNDTIINKQYHQMYIDLDDSFFTALFRDDYKLKNLVQLKNEIEDKYNYLVIGSQDVSVKETEMPDECLNGYESGNAKYAIQYDDEGVKYSIVKSLQVSDNFFDEFGIKPQQGKLFTEEDFKYKPNHPIPVILGAAYSNFKIGDTFEGYFLSDDLQTLKVIAVLPSNSVWTSGQSANYTDRYIILPSFTVEEDNSDDFAKKLLLDQLGGIIIDNSDFEQVERDVRQIAADNEVPYGANGIGLLNSADMTNSLEEYSKMTESIKKQFASLLTVLIIFVIFSLSVTVNGFVRSHHYEFGVKLLNGATVSDVALQIFSLLSIIIGLSSLMAFIALVMVWKFTPYLLLIPLFLIVVSAVFPIYHIRNIDVSEIISGKE